VCVAVQHQCALCSDWTCLSDVGSAGRRSCVTFHTHCRVAASASDTIAGTGCRSAADAGGHPFFCTVYTATLLVSVDPAWPLDFACVTSLVYDSGHQPEQGSTVSPMSVPSKYPSDSKNMIHQPSVMFNKALTSLLTHCALYASHPTLLAPDTQPLVAAALQPGCCRCWHKPAVLERLGYSPNVGKGKTRNGLCCPS
jgi:hypothetical protein